MNDDLLKKGSYIRCLCSKLNDYDNELKDLHLGLKKYSESNGKKIINAECFKSVGVVKGKYYDMNNIKKITNNRIMELNDLRENLNSKIIKEKKILADEIVKETSENKLRNELMSNLEEVTRINETLRMISRIISKTPRDYSYSIPKKLLQIKNYSETQRKLIERRDELTSINNNIRDFLEIFALIEDDEEEISYEFNDGVEERSILNEIYISESINEIVDSLHDIMTSF